MKASRASFTAAYVAACRSLGRALSEDARLVDDPFSARFAGSAAGLLVDRFASAQPDSLRASIAARIPLVMYMQVRTRALDDVVDAFAESGGQQVVLLGAGFDARAERMHGLQFYEVDHPATQREKRRRRSEIPGPSPFAYVAFDFERDPMSALPDALAREGHDRALPTLTIWEGVTMYLSPEAIEASVLAIRSYSSKGSKLAMNYFDRAWLEHPSPIRRAAHAVVKVAGEPFRFGFSPHELKRWLAARGFHLDHDDDIRTLAHRLLPARHLSRVEGASSRIAVATAV